jgi:hypothetical protein
MDTAADGILGLVRGATRRLGLRLRTIKAQSQKTLNLRARKLDDSSWRVGRLTSQPLCCVQIFDRQLSLKRHDKSPKIPRHNNANSKCLRPETNV